MSLPAHGNSVRNGTCPGRPWVRTPRLRCCFENIRSILLVFMRTASHWGKRTFRDSYWTWSIMRARTELVLFLALFLMTGPVPSSWISERTRDEMNTITLSEGAVHCFFFIQIFTFWGALHTDSPASPGSLPVFGVLCSHTWLVALRLGRWGMDGWDLRLTLSPSLVTREIW